ncbi:MAG: hypothetical protein PWQ39_163 [Thermacetogenium sp.]|nr:hypothetical protein [Thermacetogenium sp.]
MQVFINAGPDKIESFAKATNISFKPLSEARPAGDAVAVVVQGASFKDDLPVSVGLGVPVVVVAGNESAGEFIEDALKFGVPEPCILVKRGDRVCGLDGREIAPAVGRGIGIRAVVKAAEHALKNGLYPEPLVWVEEEEPVVFQEPEPPGEGHPEAKPPELPAKEARPKVVPLAREAGVEARLEGILEMAERILAVFRSTSDAESGPVARDLAARLDGVHLELSPKPSSYAFYGKTLEEALRSGKYLYASSSAFAGNGYAGAKWLIVEIDVEIMPSLPALVDKIYRRAEKIIHAVGEKEGQAALKTWLESGWKLEAVVPNRSVFDSIKRAFGKIVFPDASALVAQFT